MSNLTLLLLTHNEQENIAKNFKWLDKCPSINEIIVIDDNSEDKTIEAVKKLSSKNRQVSIHSRGLDTNFSAQRQFGVSKSTNDWILWLDPDETPNKKFIRFTNHIDINKYHNYAFRRHDIFLGHELKYGETSSQYFLRLFNKNFGRFVGQVHEIWQTDQPVFHSDAYITHQSHSNLKSFFNKINFYSDIRAQELKNNGVKTNLFQIIFYPKAKFIQNYIFRLGFLDSTPGIILALGMSFHSFLVRAKLWHLSNS
jgi:glycosyltransferase involved in cell wall biosynthesis